MEYFCGRFRGVHLPFLEHRHDFNRSQRTFGSVKVFESHHRSRPPLYASMVLFKHIAQVFALADFDACLNVSVQQCKDRFIGTALLNVVKGGFSIFTDGFFE
jgi:hypothetical protein